MQNLDGIISLLIACLETVLVINLIVFGKKNVVNILAILLVILLAVYQLLEFLICFAGCNSSFIIYIALADITFLPPLSLLTVLRYWNYQSKFIYLIFLPAIIFILIYPFVIDQFVVTKCTVLYATYNYPFGDAYGFFYYLPILTMIVFLIRKIINGVDKEKLKLSKIILAGYICLTVPIIVGVIISFSFTDLIESIMCKLGFVVALCFSYVVLKNKGKEIKVD
ncbi:MAG: hypothetical protein NTX22_15805 [Ignavibacteriales bacterium]|nr:hypothetical protein [Ignavibacteriales bacterium]